MNASFIALKEKKKRPLGISTPKTRKKAGPRSDNSPNIRHYQVKKNKTENNEAAMSKYRDSTDEVRSMVNPRVHMKNENYEKVTKNEKLKTNTNVRPRRDPPP